MPPNYAQFLRSLSRQYSAEAAIYSGMASEHERLADRLVELVAQCSDHDPAPIAVSQEVGALLELHTARIEAHTANLKTIWATTRRAYLDEHL